MLSFRQFPLRPILQTHNLGDYEFTFLRSSKQAVLSIKHTTEVNDGITIIRHPDSKIIKKIANHCFNQDPPDYKKIVSYLAKSDEMACAELADKLNQILSHFEKKPRSSRSFSLD